MPYRPAPARFAALVLFAHVGLLALMWRAGVWADRSNPQRTQPSLVWLGLQPAARADTAPAEIQAARRPRPSSARPIPAPSPTTAPSAHAQPTTSPAAEPQPITLAAPAVPSSGAPLAGPLNLQLPRSASAPWGQRNPALDDPRSNTARLTLEQRLAHAMGGDGSWTFERLDNDRVRMRQGARCVMVTRSRAGQLELAGGAFRDLWAASDCS